MTEKLAASDVEQRWGRLQDAISQRDGNTDIDKAIIWARLREQDLREAQTLLRAAPEQLADGQRVGLSQPSFKRDDAHQLPVTAAKSSVQQQQPPNWSTLPHIELHFPASAEIGAGESAVVYKVKWCGDPAAVKIYPVGFMADMRAEYVAYLRLRHLQSHVIPRIRAAGFTGGYRCCFITMSLIDGQPLHACQVTADVADAALSAVQQLHDAGYVHGDLQLGSMLLVASTATAPAKVMLVDLVDTRVGSPAERAAEMAQLCYMLQHRWTEDTCASTL